MGCAKPDSKIYELVEKESGYDPEHIVFFDDSPANISAACARGWNAFCVEEGKWNDIQKGLLCISDICSDNNVETQ